MAYRNFDGFFELLKEKVRLVEALEDVDEDQNQFACNKGPNQREMCDSMKSFFGHPYIPMLFQAFDKKGYMIPLKIHGMFPLNLFGAGFRNNEEYLIKAEVVAGVGWDDSKAIVVNNGKTCLRAGDIVLGVYCPYQRFGSFVRIMDKTQSGA